MFTVETGGGTACRGVLFVRVMGVVLSDVILFFRFSLQRIVFQIFVKIMFFS